MKVPPFQIKKFGPGALLLEWPQQVQLETLLDIAGFTRFLRSGKLPEADWELIPVYCSLTLYKHGSAIDAGKLIPQIQAWYAEYPGPGAADTRTWELPVCYTGDFAPDLEATAGYLGITPDALVALHSGTTYRVYGVGFLPGFLYLGGVPEALEIPRRNTPRLRVPKGSVGLAGKQTGIYPQESPGGWHLIGNCPIPLFDPGRKPPFFINLGDAVCFRPVSEAEYNLHRIEAEVGLYSFEKKSRHA